MSDAHVQTVARRIASLAPGHDGENTSHLYEMFTYLHAVAYQDFAHEEIDTTDAPTVNAVRGAVDAFAAAAHTFDATRANADTLREALIACSGPGGRQYQLGLVKKVLATMDPEHTATNRDQSWAGAALSALSLNYLGVYPGNQDKEFQAAVAADPGYRAAFKAFADYTHLKDTPNAWVVRDALLEYGRFGEIDSLEQQTITDLGALLPVTVQNFGEGSAPWGKVVSWLITFEACEPYGVCKEDIEKRIFPHTYSYDNGGIKVRTALDRATVDQLYYASKQVRAQFYRVLGTEEPLAGDPNATLGIVLYAARSDYEVYHPMLTGMGTDNGGVYIEQGATFYTYQRRVPQDSSQLSMGAHHLMVAGHVVPGQVIAQLLLQHGAGEGQIGGRALVHQVPVDHQEVGPGRLDLPQGAAGLSDDRAARIAGHELRVGHHREPPVASPHLCGGGDQRIGAHALRGQFDGGRHPRREVVDDHTAGVLAGGGGLGEVEAVDLQRIRDPGRDGEVDMPPSGPGDIRSAEQLVRARGVLEVQCGPRPLAVALDPQAEGLRLPVHLESWAARGLANATGGTATPWGQGTRVVHTHSAPALPRS
ncbi:hypothetical protein SANTM175S_00271 [Streptomyces antimycoticus]